MKTVWAVFVGFLFVLALPNVGCSTKKQFRINSAQLKKGDRILELLEALRFERAADKQSQIALELKETILRPGSEKLPSVFILPLDVAGSPVEWRQSGSNEHIKSVLIHDPFSQPPQYLEMRVPILSPATIEAFRQTMQSGPL